MIDRWKSSFSSAGDGEQRPDLGQTRKAGAALASATFDTLTVAGIAV